MESWNITKLPFVAYALVGLAAIAFLPTLAPSAPTASDSYLFGYNNRVGISLLLLLVAIGVVWTKGIKFGFRSEGASRLVPNRTLAFSLITVLTGCVIMYLFAGRYGGFGESYYLIDRARLLAEGKAPYRDFQFSYGAALLYGPVVIDFLFRTGIANAYYIFWMSNFLLGTFLLFKSVNMVDYPTPRKRQIFLLLYFAGLFAIIRMGTNYTFLRFVPALFFVLVIQRMFKNPADRWNAGPVLASVLFAAILILISPETALAFAFACVWICLFLRGETALGRGANVATLLAGFSIVFWTAKEFHVLDTVLADAGGADDFPIMMAPHILVFFFAVFVCGCYVYWRIRDRRLRDNTIGLIGYSLPTLAAALGRCDPSHVYWNGLAVFLASMFYVSNRAKAWALYACAFLLFVMLLPNAAEFYLFVPKQLSGVVYLNNHPEERSKNKDVLDLFPNYSGKLLAPFGYRPDGLGTLVSARIDYGRYEDLTNVYTPRSVAEKVEEMRQSPEKALVLPEHAFDLCRTNPRKERHYLSVLFVFPYFGRAVHPESVQDPICDYIREKYRVEQEPSQETFWYGIWVPKLTDRLQEAR